MLSANDQHLSRFLLIETFINFAHARDEVFMHERHFTFLLIEGHLRDNVLEWDKLTSKSTDWNSRLSKLEKALCMIDKLLRISNAF